MTGMLWDVHLEGVGYEAKRLEEVGQYRKAFIARRCPVSPVDSPAGVNGAAVRAKGIYAHLSEDERLKKEQDMDAWRMEQFKRRDEERRLKEEARLKKEQEERAAAKLKQQKDEIHRTTNLKAKKVTGYQLFAAEKRKQLQNADPNMASTQITKLCKVSWETCNKTIQKQYDAYAKSQNKAERERVQAEKKKARALAAKLEKAERARERAAAAAAEDEVDEIEWIMCEQCKKWRVVPAEIANLLDSTQTTAWNCSMNTWDPPPPAGTAACDVPQQSIGDEDAEDEAGDEVSAAMAWPPQKFEIGMPCDAQDEFGNFYKAKIVQLGDPNGPDKHNVKVHYHGWGSRYDEWIDSRPSAGLLAKRGTHTKRAKPKNIFHGVDKSEPEESQENVTSDTAKRKCDEVTEQGSPRKKQATTVAEGESAVAS